MTEKEIAQFDQAWTDLVRTVPGALKSFYDALIEHGFSEDKATFFSTIFLQSFLPQR